MKGIFLSALMFGSLSVVLPAGAQPATATESTQVFPTYAFSDPSPLPLLSPVYPYFRFDGFDTKPVDKTWKTVILENAYVRVMILPEIGGKIWAAIDKKNGHSFLYYNHAVKFRDVAMRGPWTSGGLEANYGIIGHTPNCATPVDYLVRTNADSSVSCVIGAMDLLSRSYWRMEINLPADKAFFSTSSFWYNTSAMEQPYYHWMNAGLKAGDDLEFIYPGNKYLGHEGEHAAWPVNETNGKHIAWYRENNFGGYKSYHVFGKYADFAGTYWHNDGYGMVRYGTHDDKPGKKLWIWGLSRQGMIWEKLLSDTDGQYIELQSGRLFNQNAPGSSLTPFKHIGFRPYQTDTWKEFWYGVAGTDGFVTASTYGALNLQEKNGWTVIRFSPVQAISDTLRIVAAGSVLYERKLALKPMETFTDSFRLPVTGSEYTTDSVRLSLGGHKLEYDASPAAGDLSRPVETPGSFDWSSAYGQLVKGEEALDQKLYPEAEVALDSSLRKDPNFLPALVKMAELDYRNLRFAAGLSLALRALAINSDDGAANFIYGLLSESNGKYTDAKDGFDIAALDPAFRSAAQSRLIRCWLREGNTDRASAAADKALAAQPSNIDALQWRAVLYRLSGDTAGYRHSLQLLQALDPLNIFARYETAAYDGHRVTTIDSARFAAGFRAELPQEYFLELADWYLSGSQSTEAIRVLRLAPAVAEVQCWLAYLDNRLPDFDRLDPVRAFPSRAGAATIFASFAARSNHWFPRYQLALIYESRHRRPEALALLRSCENSSAYAPFYAFRAALTATEDSTAIETDLQRALSLDPQWRYQKLLAEFYLEHQQSVRAEAIAGKYYQKHPASYIMGMLYAQTLLLDKKFAAADKLLDGLTIVPFEGATSGRGLYRETKLMLAVMAFNRHDYSTALRRTAEARLWPERLGVGEPYPEEQDLRLEDWLDYRCYTALHRDPDATAALRKIVAFHPRTDNTVPNFIPANDQITGWANSRLGLTAAAVVPATTPATGRKRAAGANERILAALVP